MTAVCSRRDQVSPASIPLILFSSQRGDQGADAGGGATGGGRDRKERVNKQMQEDFEEVSLDDLEFYDYDAEMPKAEEISAALFCQRCRWTYLFHYKSYPGDRDHTDIKCPRCNRKIGNGDTEVRLIAEVKGRASHEELQKPELQIETL